MDGRLDTREGKSAPCRRGTGVGGVPAVPLERGYFYCGGCGTGRYPLDEVLGIPGGIPGREHFSDGVQQGVCLLGVVRSHALREGKREGLAGEAARSEIHYFETNCFETNCFETNCFETNYERLRYSTYRRAGYPGGVSYWQWHGGECLRACVPACLRACVPACLQATDWCSHERGRYVLGQEGSARSAHAESRTIEIREIKRVIYQEVAATLNPAMSLL